MKTRVLPSEEWGRITEGVLPGWLSLLPPSEVSVVVIEDGDRIVATMGVMRLTHFEGCWIDPEHRGNPGVVRRLLREAGAAARKWSNEWVMVQPVDDRVGKYVLRLGGTEVKGASYVMGLG